MLVTGWVPHKAYQPPPTTLLYFSPALSNTVAFFVGAFHLLFIKFGNPHHYQGSKKYKLQALIPASSSG
jgi:hypothetical protein